MPDDIAIIGGGPAGLIAAERLAGAGNSVTVYERMPTLGRRFLMAGIGGLNLTHAEDHAAFLARYREAAPWLEPALAGFGPEAVRAWADGLGAGCFTGSSGRVFPKAMKASPLLRAWLARLEGLGVRFETRHDWRGWADGALNFETPQGTRHVWPAATLLALGGASWRRLGANGAWVPLLGPQSVAPLTPSNCGVRIGWSDHLKDRFAGAPLKNIAVSVGETRHRGEAVLTVTGLEGGAVYALSGALRGALAAGPAALTLDLKPDLDAATLTARLSNTRKGESLANRLRKAARLDPPAIALLRENGPPPAEAATLAAHIKALTLRIEGLAGMERAISTAGGVRQTALDERFMLRDRPGVFAAGEMLDWDAPTGGYLLTACLATGMAAAEGMLGWLEAN